MWNDVTRWNVLHLRACHRFFLHCFFASFCTLQLVPFLRQRSSEGAVKIWWTSHEHRLWIQTKTFQGHALDEQWNHVWSQAPRARDASEASEATRITAAKDMMPWCHDATCPPKRSQSTELVKDSCWNMLKLHPSIHSSIHHHPFIIHLSSTLW